MFLAVEMNLYQPACITYECIKLLAPTKQINKETNLGTIFPRNHSHNQQMQHSQCSELGTAPPASSIPLTSREKQGICWNTSRNIGP